MPDDTHPAIALLQFATRAAKLLHAAANKLAHAEADAIALAVTGDCAMLIEDTTGTDLTTGSKTIRHHAAQLAELLDRKPTPADPLDCGGPILTVIEVTLTLASLDAQYHPEAARHANADLARRLLQAWRTRWPLLQLRSAWDADVMRLKLAVRERVAKKAAKEDAEREAREKPEDNALYLPARVYTEKYGIAQTNLQKAAQRGKIKVRGPKHARLYRDPDVRIFWPGRFVPRDSPAG